MQPIPEDDYLAHYGVLRRSGRYPWGSGGENHTPQDNWSFLDWVKSLRSKGMSESEIAEGFGMNSTQLRQAKTFARAQVKLSDIAQAQRLKDRGWSTQAIAERMGKPEATVRTLLAPGAADKAKILFATSEMLKQQVDERGFIDVGLGSEHYVGPGGVSKEKLASAVAILQGDGYELVPVQIDQLGTGKMTNTKVLAPPGTTYKDVVTQKEKIQSIDEFSEDGGRSFLGMKPPIPVDPKRVAINYAEDGGADADGVMYVRPGVEDISLGGNRYAQVRVQVSDSHYIKGMAMYKDDLPDGVDILFNTNKPKGTPMMGPKDKSVLKPLKNDDDNPFGAVIKRQIQTPDGKVKSAMNIVNEEGDWDEWSRTLSSQMLSKQSRQLAKQQLDMTYQRKQQELDDILALTNPVVQQHMLEEFADSADGSAVHLKAAALPRQASHVILPMNSLKPTEIYAPNYNHGETVTLVRFPHGGTFEIPELVVNNRNPKAKKALGQAKDAVGINSEVAKRLSGADFDGDSVLVIPNNRGAIKTKPPLKELANFDPQGSYKAPSGTPWKGNTQQLMGDISNLITDMTIKGAPDHEIARAVKHSMVVIDAEKHGLDYKRSALDHGIPSLKEKYQGGKRSGAATIVSRKKRDVEVPERKLSYRIDPITGKKIYNETGKSYVDKTTGQTVKRVSKSKLLLEVDNAHDLSSGTPMEKLYADHSNRLKALGNEARKKSVRIKYPPASPSAKTAYQKEVAELDAALRLAQKNAPRERKAQLVASATVKMKQAQNPDMDKAELKKIKGQALTEARTRLGASKQKISFTDKQWEAIQAGAISSSKLSQILKNADPDRVKELATPKDRLLMTSIKKQRATAMLAIGYTQAEVAAQLGVSLTTLKNSFK